MKPHEFFDAFTKAIKEAGGFQAIDVPDRGFNPWLFDGMHDAAAFDRKVAKRSVFGRSSNLQGETVQLDLLRYQDGKEQAAVFIRIHEAKKRAKNTANATLKSDRVNDTGDYFVEFGGKTDRRKRVHAILSSDKRLRLDGNKIIIGNIVCPKFIEDIVLAARLIARAEQ